MIRQPAVAGQFYQGSPSALRDQVERFVDPKAKKIKALGIVSPHAGLVYSGSVAGAVYSRVELPGTFVLIGPNHTGLGAPVSIMTKGSWETPLGNVRIDEELGAYEKATSTQIRINDNLPRVSVRACPLDVRGLGFQETWWLLSSPFRRLSLFALGRNRILWSI